MASQLINPGRQQRKWLLLCQELAEQSKLFAQLSDADKARSLRGALEDALNLGRALGFGCKECREEFQKLFGVLVPAPPDALAAGARRSSVPFWKRSR